MVFTAVNYFRIGKIINTQGLKGEVRVLPLTDDVKRFDDAKFVFIDDQKLIKTDVEHVRYQKDLVIIKFKNIDTIEDAEKLKNTYILIDRKNAIKLSNDRYFVCDIIGLLVYSTDDCFYGEITDVIQTGSNDVYVVKNHNKEILIPALKTVVKEIDINNGRMVVELPEGLI